jgi:hypothetical protein
MKCLYQARRWGPGYDYIVIDFNVIIKFTSFANSF